MNKKFYFFIGTNAELIKLAAVFRRLKEKRIEYKIIVSGQNKVNFEFLKDFSKVSAADITLKEKVNKSSLLLFAFWALRTLIVGAVTLRKEFKGLNKKNSYFIIHGDTVTSLIGGIIA